jgi:PAS domain S-box-containing protein
VKYSVLIVDADESTRNHISSVLQSDGYMVKATAPDQGEVLHALLRESPDLLLIDTAAVTAGLLAHSPETPVMYLVSTDHPEDTPLPAPTPMCFGFLPKDPGAPSLLLRSVETAIMRSRQERDVTRDYQSYRFFFDHIPIASIVSDPDYTILHWNRGAEELFGYSSDEAVGRVLTELLYSQKNDLSQDDLKKILLGSLQVNRRHQKVNYDRTKDGWDILCEWQDFHYRDDARQYILSVASDITERRALIDTLKTTIEQKDFLMREIYHRLKNNLNMIGSLIHLKIDEVEARSDGNSSSTASVLQDVGQKISAFSILYEMLHQHGDNPGSIDLAPYLEELLDTLFSSLSDLPCTVRSNLEAVQVEPQKAVILGLITNEIATNTLKHGLPPHGEGRFTVSLSHPGAGKGENLCIYTLENSGPPFPDEVDVDTSRSLGLRLIFSLVDQLGGTVHLRKAPTPRYTIEFPVP